jgi:integration host factor subunit beta
MLKSELAARLAARYELANRDAERAINVVLDAIGMALARGQRIELRGFGAFSVKRRPSRVGRNPRNGVSVMVAEKRQPYFRTGKEMRERLNGTDTSGR